MASRPPAGSVLQERPTALAPTVVKASAPPPGSKLVSTQSSRDIGQEVFRQGINIAGPGGAAATLARPEVQRGIADQTPVNRQELSQKIIPQFTKGLEERLPGGKQIVNAINPEMQEDFPDPEGVLPWLGRQAGRLAPDIAMAAPFEGVAGLIPKISPLGRAAVGFGAYEGSRDVVEGRYKEAPLDALKTTAAIWGGGLALQGAGKVIGKGAELVGQGASRASLAIKTLRGKLNESELGQFINKSIQKSIGVNAAGKNSASMADKYLSDAKQAVFEIIGRKNNLKFVNELGDEVQGQLPRSLDDFNHAVDQTKEVIFKEYDELAKRAGDKGVVINWGPVADDIEAQVSDPAVRTVFPELTAYATDLAERLRLDKIVTPESAQKVIAMLNSTLKAYNRNPNPQMASRVVVDLAIATKLRNAVDAAIEGAVGRPGYAALKRAYGSLRAIQENVARRAAALGSKGPGALDLVGILTRGDIVSGLASLNAPQVTRGVVQETLRQWIRYINNPNRVVKNMFEVAEKYYAKDPLIPPRSVKGAFPGAIPAGPKQLEGLSERTVGKINDRINPPKPKALPAPGERKLLPAPKPLTYQEELANKGMKVIKEPKALPFPRNLGEGFEILPEKEARQRLKNWMFKYGDFSSKEGRVIFPEGQVFSTKQETLLKKMGIDPVTGEIKFKPLRNAYQKAVERFKAKLKDERGFLRLQGLDAADEGGTYASPLITEIKKKLPVKSSPEQVNALLREIPQEEIEFTGVKEFLKGKDKVLKEEILGYLEKNQIQIKEVTKGSKEITSLPVQDLEPGQMYVFPEKGVVRVKDVRDTNKEGILEIVRTSGIKFEVPADMQVKLYTPQIKNNTKFSKYQTPGGENYKELLLTLPSNNNLPEGEIALSSTYKNFKSSHFDEPNVLAHVRMNDRTIQGKKTLFIEELQSDWHQKGRSKGYASSRKNTEIDADLFKEPEGTIRAQELMNELKSANFGVPNAPFKKTWQELSMKRMIKQALDKGYDKLAWTTGEQQAARYDLSKQLNALEVIKNENQTYLISGNPVGSRRSQALFKDQVKESELEGIIGKEMTKKALNDINSGKEASYSGLDLKVGGEGMKGFYDKILPDFANKFTRKWGVQVEEGVISTGKLPKGISVSEQQYIEAGKNLTVHTLDISKIREALKKPVSVAARAIENLKNKKKG